MKSVYTGMYVQKNSEGKIFGVQVHDEHNSFSMEPSQYIEREIKPNIQDLPTKEKYKKGKA